MNFVIGILACLMLLGGMLAGVASQSAMHQILAANLFGFGLLALAMLVLIQRVEDLRLKTPRSPSRQDDPRQYRRDHVAAPSGHSQE